MNKDLKTLNKLKDDIETASMISFLLPKAQREQIREMKKQFLELEESISKFNEYFTALGWCAYDFMSLKLIKKAIEYFEISGSDAGEQVLLQYYKEEVKDIVPWLKNKAAPFAQRYELIQHAFDDHFMGRYYASVPLFLIIIDGAVNDYTKSKGFFAEGTNLTAWDCLVGCSDGLVKMKSIFNKGRNKTNHEEIRMPYRNGILHGRDLNYGNEYVSCKCIALMFALADWMNMRDSEDNRKVKFEKKSNPPPILESKKIIKEIKAVRREIREWKAREVVVGKDIPFVPTKEDCVDYQYIIPVIEVFETWKMKNYGALAILLKRIISSEDSDKKRAGECRRLFSEKNFCAFELKEVEERACSLSRILVQVEWDTDQKHFSELLEFGCVYQDIDEKPVVPWRGNGKWTLLPWKGQRLFKL